jgi:hypothetical protein
MDDEKQTLNVAFKEMTTEISELEGTVITQGTQLGVVQGQISSKIWQQDITSSLDNLQIGGRNIILQSKTMGGSTHELYVGYLTYNGENLTYNSDNLYY